MPPQNVATSVLACELKAQDHKRDAYATLDAPKRPILRTFLPTIPVVPVEGTRQKQECGLFVFRFTAEADFAENGEEVLLTVGAG